MSGDIFVRVKERRFKHYDGEYRVRLIPMGSASEYGAETPDYLDSIAYDDVEANVHFIAIYPPPKARTSIMGTCAICGEDIGREAWIREHPASECEYYGYDDAPSECPPWTEKVYHMRHFRED